MALALPLGGSTYGRDCRHRSGAQGKNRTAENLGGLRHP